MIDSLARSYLLNRSGIVASRPELRSALRHIAARPREQGLRQEARDSLESFRPYGFSALVLALADGEEAARSGTRIVGPAIAAPVDNAELLAAIRGALGETAQ